MGNQKGRKHIQHRETVGGRWSKEYRAYHGMVTRVKRTKHYIERGITLCAEWDGPMGFTNFLAHVGRAPSADHEIDRIDNTQGYFPGNVRWTDRVTQMRNRSNNVNLTVDGRTQCLAAWCEEYGVSYQMVYARLSKGWDVVDALTTPPRRKAA